MSLLDGAGMTGDIWSTGAFAIESPLKDILDSGDFTIEQLLAEDELLQELRGLHPQLLEYFSSEEAVTSLVRYLILDRNAPLPTPVSEFTSPTEDAQRNMEGEGAPEEKQSEDQQPKRPAEPGMWLFQHLDDQKTATTDREKHPEANPDNYFIRFPYMACELICCELQGVLNVLVDGFVPLPKSSQSTPSSSQDDSPSSQHAAEQQESQSNSSSEGKEQEPPAAQTESNNQNEQPHDSRQRILDLLFSVLYDTDVGQLDDYRAGYLEKILSVLFRKRPQAMS